MQHNLFPRLRMAGISVYEWDRAHKGRGIMGLRSEAFVEEGKSRLLLRWSGWWSEMLDGSRFIFRFTAVERTSHSTHILCWQGKLITP